MATQDTNLTDAANRIQAGEEMGAVLGVSETQLKAIAALGYNKYQQGRLDDAETMFRGVAALDTKSYFGYAGLGAIALAKRPPDLETALTNLSKAAELKPEDATIQANLGAKVPPDQGIAPFPHEASRSLVLSPSGLVSTLRSLRSGEHTMSSGETPWPHVASCLRSLAQEHTLRPSSGNPTPPLRLPSG